jgi:CHAD domain-containing protein
MAGARYELPDDVDLDTLAARLNARADAPRPVAWTYYDTFDGRLHAAGIMLRLGEGRLAALERDGGAEVAAAERSGTPARLFAWDLPPGPLRERLEPVIEMRALTPVARVKARRRRLAVLNADEKTVVRLLAESAAVAGTPLRGRLEATAVRGYDDDLARVQRVLERKLGLIAAETTLADEAIVASGGDPAGTSSKLALTLEPAQRADEAAAIVLRRLVEVIHVNLPGTLADVDSEFLHDLRVAVRRTRSVQRQLASIFPPAGLEHFRAEFRWLQQITGDTRDLDVHLLELEPLAAALPVAVRADLEPLRIVLERRRRRAFAAMARALRSPRAVEALSGWAAFVDALPRSERAIGALASERIARVYRRMVKEGRAIDADSPPEALHDLRKIGKELRYLLELFAGLFPEPVVKPMVKSLKTLQDVLGRFQDLDVQAQELRSLRDEVGRADGGAAALMAMGLIVDRLDREQAAAHAEFGERFAAFAAPEQRATVKDTFG